MQRTLARIPNNRSESGGAVDFEVWSFSGGLGFGVFLYRPVAEFGDALDFESSLLQVQILPGLPGQMQNAECRNAE